MGQLGSAGDNAAMESFFALLQKNVLDRRRWTTRNDLRIAIVTWIERTYHQRRRQAALGRLTPIEYETIIGPAATKAAYLASLGVTAVEFLPVQETPHATNDVDPTSTSRASAGRSGCVPSLNRSAAAATRWPSWYLGRRISGIALIDC